MVAFEKVLCSVIHLLFYGDAYKGDILRRLIV
jgi:hypothetical protein